MSAQCLLGEFERNGVEVTATVRFLHHQSRTVERLGAGGAWIPVDRLVVDERESISWDEATESEIVLGPWGLDELEAGVEETFCAAGVVEGETLSDSRGRVVGRIVRTRLPVNGLLAVSASAGDGRTVISVEIMNATSVDARDKGTATAQSMLGTHVIVNCTGSRFLSLFEEADHSEQLRQNRCYPVLAGTEDPHSPWHISHRSGVTDHPVRLSRDCAAERGISLRLDRDRRNSHPENPCHDRRGKGAGASYRLQSCRHHRPM